MFFAWIARKSKYIGHGDRKQLCTTVQQYSFTVIHFDLLTTFYVAFHFLFFRNFNLVILGQMVIMGICRLSDSDFKEQHLLCGLRLIFTFFLSDLFRIGGNAYNENLSNPLRGYCSLGCMTTMMNHLFHCLWNVSFYMMEGSRAYESRQNINASKFERHADHENVHASQ